MKKTIFVFFEGNNDQWWASYNRLTTKKIRYQDLLQNFLQKLSIAKNIDLTLDEVKISFYLESSSETVHVVDLKTNIPDSNGQNFEILVQQIQTDTNKPKTKKTISTEKALDFVRIGTEFSNQKEFYDALPFFECSDYHGYMQLANIFYQNKRWSPLQSLLGYLFKYYPGNIDVVIMQCKYLEHTQNYKQALNYYLKALRFSDRTELYLGATRVFLALNDYNKAELKIKNALSINDYDPRTIKEFCKLKIQRNEYKQAIAVAMRHPDAYKLLGKIVISDENYKLFSSTIFSPIHHDNSIPFSSQAIGDIGKILFKYGQTKYAIAFLKDSLSYVQGPEIFYQLLKIFSYERDKTSFLNTLRQYIANFPNVTYIDLNPSVLTEYFNLDKPIPIPTPLKTPELIPYPPNQSCIKHLKIYVITACFLFSLGYYQHAFELRNRITSYSEYIGPPTMHGYIQRMYNFTKVTPPLPIKQDPKKKVVFFGDEYVFHTAPSHSSYSVFVSIFEHIPFPGLSLYNLFRKESKMKELLKARLNSYSNSDIGLVFGTTDCQTVIPALIRTLKFSKPIDAVKHIVDKYILFIKELKKNKKAKIIIHPAYPFKEDSARIVGIFNAYLKANIPPGVFYLNFFDRQKNRVPEICVPNKVAMNEYQFHFRKEIEQILSPPQKTK